MPADPNKASNSRRHAPPRSSRGRHARFREDYKLQQLDDREEDKGEAKPESSADGAPASVAAPSKSRRNPKRREYLREYLRWLRPHGYAVGAVFLCAIAAAA